MCTASLCLPVALPTVGFPRLPSSPVKAVSGRGGRGGGEVDKISFK